MVRDLRDGAEVGVDGGREFSRFRHGSHILFNIILCLFIVLLKLQAVCGRAARKGWRN